MTILHKLTFTRPSIHQLFIFDDLFIGQYQIDRKKQFLPGLLNWEFGENISWEEIFSRKEELCNDLKIRINQYDINDLEGKYQPGYNPFLLISTHLYTYDTWNNAKMSYDLISEVMLFPFAANIENTLSHAYYNVDGNTVTYIEDKVRPVPRRYVSKNDFWFLTLFKFVVLLAVLAML